VRSRWVAPLLAGTLALLVILTGAQGVDLAAATYRVELFARSALTLWDSQWYGGHWTFDYSVLFAPIGWLAGIALMETVCVVVAAWAFDRLAVARFGRAGRVGSIVFAVGTIVQVAIGQEPYLLGEALALIALLAARGRFWPLAAPFAVGSSLASPLAGVFLAMAAVTWLIGAWPVRSRPILVVACAAAVPVVLLEVLFPGQGAMPFAPMDFVAMCVALLPILIVAARYDRTITVGVTLYAAALVFAFVVPSAVGINITRFGTCFGVALVVILAQECRHSRGLLAVAAVPLIVTQWLPATPALLGGTNPSTRAAYFQPLLRQLRKLDRPLGRVEVVPTALHWEAAYVAPFFPLARGWERQLDTVDNPIFYSSTPPTPTAYRTWLFANGIRFVALPDVALDYSAHAEERLLRGGVPGLRLVWHNAHWRLYGVRGAPGLLSGPARLLSAGSAEIRLDMARPGTVLVRERYVAAWKVTRGGATLTPAEGDWFKVHATHSGPITLQIGF
jgi:hypothetical protein